MAVAGLAGCRPAGGERHAARAAPSNEPAAGSALPPPRASADDANRDDCGHLDPPRGPQAPSATKLSSPTRSRVTALQVLAHGSAVIVRKGPDGWVMGGPSGCAVSSQRIERALDNLSSLKVVESSEPPQQHDRQVILLDGADVLLQYDVGVGAGGEVPARLPDGLKVRVGGLDRALWSSQPSDWCSALR